MKRFYIYLVISLIGLELCFAQSHNVKHNQILLKSGVIETNNSTGTPASGNEFFDGYAFRIIQFNHIPNDEEKTKITATGLILLDYIPNYAYITAIPSSFKWEQLEKLNVRTVVALEPKHKTHEQLHQAPYPEWAITKNGIQLNVKAFKNIDRQKVVQNLERLGCTILSQRNAIKHIKISIPSSKLMQIANLPYIQWIEPIAPPPTKDDTEGRSLHRSNSINSMYTLGRKYDGTGVTVGLADDGLIGPHIDYTGRLTDYAPSNSGSHGDMTAGILFGAGNLDPTIAGMATGAYMHYWDISGYVHIVDAVLNYNNLDVILTSTSYSQGSGGEYTTDSEFIDEQIHSNPQLVHVFSAGNAGNSDHGYGAGAGWGNITGGYKASKGVITCGNLNNKDVLENSSSRGPAADGRIKPDLCANGIDQLSTDSPNTYQTGGGTSAAAPGIAGVTTQLYHAYKELNGGANPESALIKGIMLNTAEDLGRPGPDYEHGWGRINALRAVKTLEQNNYFQSSVSQSGVNNHSITVPANTQQLRVMIYWTDVNGSSSASKALVNDLDIKVIDTGAGQYDPWILDPTPNVTNLEANAIRGSDHLNNMEQVTLDNPSAGTYQVLVNGFLVPQGPQQYFVIYEIITTDIEVTYPMGGEGFAPGETQTLRWDAFGNSGDFTIEYSTDNGSSWNPIAANVAADLRYYDWVIPTAVTGQALIKVSRAGISGQSDATFTIIDVPQSLNVDWACPDSIKLSWSPVSGATAYEVSMLGTKYMDSVGTTSATSYIINGINPNSDLWLSVKALTNNNGIGRRAYAINKPPGTVNCPIAYDVAIQILSPESGSFRTCQSLNNVEVKLELTNEGNNAISNIPVFYSINGASAVSEVLSGNLNSGQTASYSFNSTVNLSSTGTYNIVAWVDHSMDDNFYNDTLYATINVINGVSVSVPWSEDFETFSTCSEASDCGAINCTMINSWYNEINDEADDIDFRTDNDGTPSGGTGPSQDHNPGTNSGNYLYLEASGSCVNKEAKLLTPCIDLSGATLPQLNYWYHMDGNDMGELHIDLLVDNHWVNDIASPVSGDQGNTWQEGNINLAPYVNSTVVVRFRGITGVDYQSDLAIDDVSITEVTSAPTADFTANKTITCPESSIIFTDLSANAPNTWSWTISPSTAVYINGTNSNSQNPEVKFLSSGIYSITLLASNNFGSNSVTKTNYIVVHPNSTAPITEDFEAAGIPSSWAVEDPGGSNTWEEANVTGSDGTPTVAVYVDNYNYNNQGAEDGLITENIDLPIVGNSILTFDIAYAPYSASYNDGLRIDVSTDCGETYSPSGYLKTGSTLATLPNQGNSFTPTNSSDWRNDAVDLSTFTGQPIKIKFVNINDWGNGLYIDNINITNTVGVDQLTNKTNSLLIYPNPNNGDFIVKYVSIDIAEKIEVYNALGAVVFSKTLNKNEVHVALSSLPTGIYTVQLSSENRVLTRKIVKQ